MVVITSTGKSISRLMNAHAAQTTTSPLFHARPGKAGGFWLLLSIARNSMDDDDCGVEFPIFTTTSIQVS